MKKSACRILVAGVAVALAVSVAPLMLAAQESEQQDKSEDANTELFELRRTLLERIENAVTRGDVSALRRMAGIEPPIERDYEALLEEASALQEEFKDIRLPTAMEQRQARDDLYEMVGEVDDRLAHVIYQAAKYAVEEDRRAMEELQALDERIEENRKKRQARGRDLAKASPVGNVSLPQSCRVRVARADSSAGSDVRVSLASNWPAREDEYDALADAWAAANQHCRAFPLNDVLGG